MQDQTKTISHTAYLSLPDKCVCEFNAESSFYRVSFPIKNTSSQTIYMSVCSSFGKFMQIEQNINQVSPDQTKILSVRLRAPNQIYPHQFIGIISSPYELNNYSSFLGPHSSLSKIKLEFNTQIIDDEMIDGYLKQQSNTILASATNLLKACQFKNARDLAQQAYGLYRKNISCLITIAEAQFNLGEFGKAAKAIEIFFYVPEHPQFYKAIIVKAETILYYMGTVPETIKLQIVKNIMQLLKQSTECNMADQVYQNRCNLAMAKFQQIKHQILSAQRDGLFDQLLAKAVQNFNQHPSLNSQFSSKQEFSSFLKKLKNIQLKSCSQTPQYALDPINYEIFKQPVITPNGMSYQKQFIANFFKKHGPQDPFTRTYLDPNSVVNNYTLKILVRNNPNLPKWIKYETQVTKF